MARGDPVNFGLNKDNSHCGKALDQTWFLLLKPSIVSHQMGAKNPKYLWVLDTGKFISKCQAPAMREAKILQQPVPLLLSGEMLGGN